MSHDEGVATEKDLCCERLLTLDVITTLITAAVAAVNKGSRA